MKLDIWGQESHLRESTISDLESPANFQVKVKKLLKSVKKQRNYSLIKNAKTSCLKWTYGRPGNDYRVASVFTRYLTAIEIIPESLKLIGQF